MGRNGSRRRWRHVLDVRQKVMFDLLGFLGIGGAGLLGLAWWFGFLPAIMAVVTPILRVLAGWIMDTINFLVRRYVREVKALFDVFPFLVFGTVFLAGGLYFHGSTVVLDSATTTVNKVIKKVGSSRKTTTRRSRQPDFVQCLFIDPFGTKECKR